MLRRHFLYLLPIMALLLASCGAGGSGHASAAEADTIAFSHARNISVVDFGDFIKADFRNPWDTTKTLQTYLLVPRDKPLPKNLPAGVALRTPLQNSVVYTSVHANLIDELGRLDAISGVCDAPYINGDGIKSRLSSGRIADCGLSTAPNIEQILLINPDAILLSAFENSNDHNKVDQLGIPIIDCIDYMEASPLAQAEWMRFFGLLYGCPQKADSLFAETEAAYNAVKAAVAGADHKPMVLTNLIYGQSWDMPGAYSTAGMLIEDAGGRNPFDSYKRSGSVKLAPEEVLYTAQDADIWLFKYYQDSPITLSQLAADNPVYTKLRPYEQGNVYGCNVNGSTYFEDVSFHPHWILAEYASLFHPELDIPSFGRKYYQRLKP